MSHIINDDIFLGLMYLDFTFLGNDILISIQLPVTSGDFMFLGIIIVITVYK